MKNKISKISIALLIASSMLLTACTNKDPLQDDNTDLGEVTENTTYKDVLNIAITANPPSLDAQGSNSNIVGAIGMHIYEPLFTLDENYEVSPVLAESYVVDETGYNYTISLRKGVTFHNGQEMIADDVVASMTRWLELSSKANTLIGGTVFEKVDDYTVEMTVNEPSSDIMLILSSPSQFAAIYPKSVIDSSDATGITEYIGTGPYVLEEYKPDQYVKLKRNVNYSPLDGEASGFAGKKDATTETIYFKVVTDDATRIAGVQTGEYDIAENIPLEDYATLSLDESIELPMKNSGTLNLFLNTTTGVLKDQTMRQAVLSALNCDDIMYAAYGDENLYSLNPGWSIETSTQWSSDAGSEYYNQNNLEKTAKLLEDAGYNNEKVVLVTTPDYSEMYKATLVVQEQLRQAGINAEVESYDFSTFMEHRADPNQFDLFVTSNSYNLLPVQLTVMGESWAGLNAPTVKEGISSIRFANSSEEASSAWNDLQGFLYEYGAASVIGHYSSVLANSTDVEGLIYFHYPVYWNVKVTE